MAKKITLFYSHNFGGLGHNQRLSRIISELTANFPEYSAILINSGENQDFLFENIARLKIINLPLLDIQEHLIVPSNENIKRQVFRKNIISKIISLPNIESIVIEHFPFGRNFLEEEIVFLVSSYRKMHSLGNVFASVRDIVELRALNKKNMDLFDRILIHSDERIISYEGLLDEHIHRKFVYTGYVVEPTDTKVQPIDNDDTPMILINLGGGRDGFSFVEDFLKKAREIPELHSYKMIVSLGKEYTDKNISHLKELYPFPFECFAYIPDFSVLQKKTIISVSMGGYNSLTEGLFHKTPVIIYPRQTDDEQVRRLETFQKWGNWIYDGRAMGASDIVKILADRKVCQDSSPLEDISFDGAFFSASFLVNFRRYQYIKIRLTNACNARCDMCGVIKRPWQSNEIGPTKESISEFHKIGGTIVNFTGGEPTIHSGFWELLQFSKELGLLTSVSTNGSTLGTKFFGKIIYNGVKLIDYIDISVDGLENNQDIRREYSGLFAKIDEGIPHLIAHNIPVHINVTVRDDNIGEMVDIFEHFKNLNVSSLSFGIITSAPNNDTSKYIPSLMELEKFYMQDKSYISSHSGDMKVTFSPDFVGGDFKAFAHSIMSNNAFERTSGSVCRFINSKQEIRINEGGNISPCCILDDMEEGLGNINNTRLLQVICSKGYENFLQRKFPDITPYCTNCKII